MVSCTSLYICFLSIMLAALPSEAKFGFRRNNDVRPEDLVAAHSSGESDEMSLLSEQEAIDIAGLLNKAKNDPQTLKLVALMKKENAKEVSTLSNEMKSDEVMLVLKQTLHEIKQLDELFESPERALKSMEEEGMIDRGRLNEYRKDPALLEEDTRRAFYYQFVTMAVAGKYL